MQNLNTQTESQNRDGELSRLAQLGQQFREDTEAVLQSELENDEFADAYQEAQNLANEVQIAEGIRQKGADWRRLEEKIGTATLEEINILQKLPDIYMSKEDYSRGIELYNKLKGLQDLAKQSEELSQIDAKDKLLITKSLRWRMLDARKAELLAQEWFGDLDLREEIPTGVIDLAEEKGKEQKTA